MTELAEAPVSSLPSADEPAAHLGAADLYLLQVASTPAISPDGTQVAFVVTRADRDTDTNIGHIWLVDDDAPPRQLTRGDGGESAPAWSPDGARLAFIAARGEAAKPQVWVLPAAGGEARAVTDAALGVSEFRWSPSGASIAYTAAVNIGAESQSDAAPVVVRRLDHKADGVGRIGSIRSHLFVVDLDGGEARQLTSGDHFVTGPAWSPDGTRLVFTTAMHDDRDIDVEMHLHVIDTAGAGAAVRLTPAGWLAGSPLWSADGSEVMFVGTPNVRALQAHLHVVPAAGGTPRDLLHDFDRNVMTGGPGYPGFPPQLVHDGRELIFSARVGGGVHGYRLRLDGGQPRHLVGTDTQLVAGAAVAKRSARMAVVTCSPVSPGDVVLLDLTDGRSRQVTDLNRELLSGRRVVQPESRRATAPDGTSIESWLWRAPEANAPLLLDIHGGPHNASHAALSPLWELWRQDVVARGWSVLAVNARGSDGYGEAFLSGAIGGWGEKDFDDFMAAVDEVIDAGIADPARLAVTGYSYGGFMTSWIIGHTDRFRAAVAGGVVTDLASFYGTSDAGSVFIPIEIGGHPRQQADLYARLSPLTYADRINTPTLILQGEADHRCPVGQAEELFTALRQRRCEVEMVLYPGAGHLFIVTGRPSHIVDYGERLVAWVTRHMGDRDAATA